MLDAQISGIQSQQHKRGRHLEMNMKVFLFQRQLKDRALRKLTKVHHREDYTEFEHGYKKQSWTANMKISYDKTVTLPNIQTTNRIEERTGGKKRCHSFKTKKSAYHSRELHQTAPQGNINSLLNLGNMEPYILVASDRRGSSCAAILEAGRKHDSLNSSLAFGEIFQVNAGNDNFEQHGTANDMHRSHNKHSETDASTHAISQAECNVNNEKDSMKTNRDVNMFHEGIAGVRTRGRKAKKTKRAVVDDRFELLHKLLIRQQPPNEGFTELSPSSGRKTSLNSVRDTLAKLSIGKEQTYNE